MDSLKKIEMITTDGQLSLRCLETKLERRG